MKIRSNARPTMLQAFNNALPAIGRLSEIPLPLTPANKRIDWSTTFSSFKRCCLNRLFSSSCTRSTSSQIQRSRKLLAEVKTPKALSCSRKDAVDSAKTVLSSVASIQLLPYSGSDWPCDTAGNAALPKKADDPLTCFAHTVVPCGCSTSPDVRVKGCPKSNSLDFLGGRSWTRGRLNAVNH